MAEPTRMWLEAHEAPDVIARQIEANDAIAQKLGARLRDLDPAFVVTSARGSSDCAATYGKYLIETRLRAPVASMAASISSVYNAPLKLKGAAFIAISQSGRSPDLLATVEAANKAGALTIALVNDETSPLASLAHECLPLRAGKEQSVAATKTMIASLSAIAHLVSAWRGDAESAANLRAAPALLTQAVNVDWRAAVPKMKDAAGALVLGRGLVFGAAQEVALKIKETCGLHAEGFSAAEVRHGPMALVRDGRVVLALRSSDAAGPSVDETLAGFPPELVLTAGVNAPLALPACPAEIEPLAFVAAAYPMIDALAAARGQNPDAPHGLSKVTKTT